MVSYGKSKADAYADQDLPEGDRQKKRIGELIECVRRDWNDNESFRESQTHWENTRYSNIDRGQGRLWEGSSDINLSVSDVYATQIVPSLLNGLFGGAKVVEMDPLDEDAMVNVASADLAANAMIRRIPDGKLNMAYAINAAATGGRGIIKVHHSKRCYVENECIHRDKLPGVLGEISYAPKISEQERMRRMQLIAQIKPDSFQRVAGMFGEPASVLNTQAFDRHKDLIEQLIVEYYGWEPEDETDKNETDRKAVDALMSWLRGGCKEEELIVRAWSELENTVRWSFVEVSDLIVPLGTTEFADAERLTHRLYFTRDQLIARGRDNGWPDEGIEKILKTDPQAHPATGTMSDGMRESEWSRTDVDGRGDHYELWETYFHRDMGDGTVERFVALVHPDTACVLKERPFPYSHGEWPFVFIPFEAHKPEFHSSRGIPKIVQDIESHVRAWHRHMENVMVLGSTLTFTYRRNAFTAVDDFELVPGVGIPTNDPLSDINPLQFPMGALPAIEQIQQFLLLWPERMIGGVDHQLSDDAHLERPRTATQTNMMESARQRVLGMRMTILGEAFAKIARQSWALHRQYGPFKLLASSPGEPSLWKTQFEIRGKYELMPVAAVGNADPTFRANQKFQILQTLSQLAPLLAQDLDYKPPALGRMAADWLAEVSPLAAKAYLTKRTPQEKQQLVAQILQRFQTQGAAADIAQRMINNEQVTEQELYLATEMALTMAPHKDLQRVIEAGGQAQQQAVGAMAQAGAQ